MCNQMDFLKEEKVQLIKLDCVYGIISGEGSRECIFLKNWEKLINSNKKV